MDGRESIRVSNAIPLDRGVGHAARMLHRPPTSRSKRRGGRAAVGAALSEATVGDRHRDFLQRFRGGIWALVGLALVIALAIIIS